MLGALLKVVQFFLQLVYDKFLYIKYTVVKYEGGGGSNFLLTLTGVPQFILYPPDLPKYSVGLGFNYKNMIKL